MEHTEVLNLWKIYDDKVEQALSLNKKNTQEILRIKTKSVLSEMKPIKIFTLFVGIIWVLFGGTVVTNLFVYAYDKVSLFFLYSAAAQLLLTAVAIGIYLYQLFGYILSTGLCFCFNSIPFITTQLVYSRTIAIISNIFL